MWTLVGITRKSPQCLIFFTAVKLKTHVLLFKLLFQEIAFSRSLTLNPNKMSVLQTQILA